MPRPEAPANDSNVEIVERPTADNPNFIFRIGINIYISNVRQERDRYYNRDRDQIYYEDLDRGRIRETIVRPDGTRIVTVYNRYGDVLKRTKIFPDDREFYLATYDPRDDDTDDSFFIDPGDELPPLRLTIPASEYILDADSADEDEVEFFLDQPPVEKVRRIYSIDEVKRSARIRDTVRRLEVGDLTFDSGKATISRDQVGSLSKVAKAMLALLDRNPAEVFLIEGHTDATGSDQANLILSDQRASTVARILTDFYEIPPENLTTQGYGERYLKVQTDEARRAQPPRHRQAHHATGDLRDRGQLSTVTINAKGRVSTRPFCLRGCRFGRRKRLELDRIELPEPAHGHGVDRHRIEEVQLLAAALLRHDQARLFQRQQMLGHGLPADRQTLAELGQRLPVAAAQSLQQHTPIFVGKRGEYRVPLR